MESHESESMLVIVILAFIIFAALWLGYLVVRAG